MPSDYKAITERNEARLGTDAVSRKTQIAIYDANSTQFVYELLQNAEDCGATDILFKLLGDAIVIEHNGKPFDQADVEGITYFGKSTRPEDFIKTGRFGIGFKSVFAFTATPIIVSGTEHFKIYDLYRVKKFPYPDGEYPNLFVYTENEGSLHFGTRIVLPFNHDSERPKFIEERIPKEKAYEQIKTSLTNPDWEIFLSKRSIQKISWQIYHYETLFTQKIRRNDKIIYINANEQEVKNPKEVYPETSGSMEIEKIGDENRIKVSGNYKSGQYNYLRFDDDISITDENIGKCENCQISVAFGMDENGKIKPLEVGKVFTSFPAAKERAGLLFHLHAPFVSTPARDSLLDCSFNNKLRDHLANLVAKSMCTICENGLLDTTFLSVLPNSKDKLPTFYQPIQERLIEEFNTQKLVPMKHRGYAAGSECYRAGKYSKDLSNLISDEDLATLLGKRGRVSNEILQLFSRYRLLSKEEERALVRINSAESKEQLINSNLRLVAAIVHRQFGGCMMEADDLFNEGVKGLKEASNNYTLSHNKFSTFATHYIRNAIQNYIDANQCSVNVSAASPLLWIKTPQIGSREDNFLSLLDISEWTIDDFIKELKTQSHIVNNWLNRKSPDWHAELYELLGSFLSKKPVARALNISDYIISIRNLFLNDPPLGNGISVDKAKLIWQMMIFLDTQEQSSADCHDLYVTAIQKLKEAVWIPQNSDQLNFVKPRKASVDYLPKGFQYEAEQKWLKAIEFGLADRKQKKQNEELVAKLDKLGKKHDMFTDQFLDILKSDEFNEWITAYKEQKTDEYPIRNDQQPSISPLSVDNGFTTIAEVQKRFGITYTVDDFIMAEASMPSTEFLQDFEFTREHIHIFASDAARRETIIFPVLKETYKTYADQYALWIKQSISYHDLLSGTPDYFISTRSELGKTVVGSPLILLVEAKKNDFEQGWGQCLAELVAAQKINDDTAFPVYGIVTDGTLWQFGRLIGDTFTQNRTDFTLANLPTLFGAVDSVFKAVDG